MIVLGLHFGRGASAAVVKDGVPLLLLERERLVRRKQAAGLGAREIEDALAYVGLSVASVDVCAVAALQDVRVVQEIRNDDGLLWPDGSLTCCEDSEVGQEPPLQKVCVGGRELPAYKVPHHMAHAAAAYFASPFDEAVILSSDAGISGSAPCSGMSYWAQSHTLRPLRAHYGVGPFVYDATAHAMGLGAAGGAGKLMGLAPYGAPVFYCDGDEERLRDDIIRAPARWLDLCQERAIRLGYDCVRPAPDHDPLSHFARDLAASTQLLFERDRLASLQEVHGEMERQGLTSPNLCLSGGAALNCPANSMVADKGGFASLSVPPFCDDSGLSLGAALLISAHHTGQRAGATQKIYPYLGREPAQEDYACALREVADRVVIEPCDGDAAPRAAQLLAEGNSIGWYEGRSEVGPRALGHRSILASPLEKENWGKVNRIKKRESWRPFAPAVLAHKAQDWFGGSPLPSPAMLFTHHVLSPRLPAITHVDGSARVQTVTQENGAFYTLLEAFDRITGVPVLLNTSLNGPDEPIVDTPADALAMFLASDLDALFFPFCCIRRGR